MKILHYSLISMLIFNLSLIAGFVIGKPIFKNEDNRDFASNYSIFLSVLLVFYFLSIITFSIFAISHKHLLYGLILLLFLFIPFIIGKVSKYEKFSFYTNVQILTFVVSFLVGILIFKFI